MCFSIPKEVISVDKERATLEDRSIARFDKSLDVHKGQYVEVTGSIIVSVLSKTAGTSIRKLIASSL